MLGWINDCIEKYVIDKWGVDTWHAIKENAGCDVKDGGFLKLENYHDESTVVLAEATYEITGESIPEVYRGMGAYFAHYVSRHGYENLLLCQGHTLKEWMAGINAIHGHLQTTFPNKMTMPEFWCEENDDGTLSLFYMSSRGSYLAPLAEGLVTEVAKLAFELDIIMTLVSTQGEEGARFTSWIISTEQPEDLPKLRFTTAALEEYDAVNKKGNPSMKCPMTGMVVTAGCVPESVDTATLDTMSVTEYSLAESTSGRPKVSRKKSGPFGGMLSGRRGSLSNSNHSRGSKGSRGSGHTKASSDSGDEAGSVGFEAGSLSSATTRKLFPYHVVIDQDFAIVQVGCNLSKVLKTNDNVLHSYDIDELFAFVQPKPAKWTRSWMRKLEDQEFILKCTLDSAPANVIFKGTLVATNPGEAMLVICPQADNLEELRDMQLTMSDLPAHGAYRDVIFLREHLSKQLNNALKMEKLSLTLQTEKELLESLLPQHAAEGLRKGQTVEPRIHYNVTMFFSDIVGFTCICKEIPPTEVVEMLNRLYMIMDYCAKKFNCFKVETIGDAYVAASGLPDADVNHAVNIANFAVAVNHCCRRVLSPLDASPINLRIGVNSGRCASGIVGVTAPRYCVFGDTVNTTARHESTGEPGKVHCSMTTMIELLKRGNDEFVHDSRGMVDMKGKGPIPTYWLSSTDNNPLTGAEALKKLDQEIMKKFAEKLAQEDIYERVRKRAASAAAVPAAASAPAPPRAAAAPQNMDPDETSIDAEEDDETTTFGDSTTSFGSSMPYGTSPLGTSRRSSYTPSKNELLQMLGQFLDGEEYDEIVPKGKAAQADSESTLPFTEAVDEALRIIDNEDD